MKPHIELGIDSVNYTGTLSAAQKDALLSELKKRKSFQKHCGDYFGEYYHYSSECFADQGVKIQVKKSAKIPWRLSLIVHPTLVLGEKDRSKLWQPTKKGFRAMENTLVSKLAKVRLELSPEALSLSRVDVTANLEFDDAELVAEYLRIIKKSRILPHYKADWFREKDGKARDCREANRHSYKQSCKQGAIFAYDKTAQLQMIDRLPDALIGKRILRIEAQLRQKGMQKWAPAKVCTSSWDIIHALFKKGKSILHWYLRRMQPVDTPYRRYETAVAQAQAIRGEKTRTRILYLLRKMSDCRDLDAALEKTAAHFGLNRRKQKSLLKTCNKKGINPVTLTNSGVYEALPPLSKLL